MNMKLKIAALVGASLLAGQAQAQVVTYTNEASYYAATTGNQTFNFAGQALGSAVGLGTTYTQPSTPTVTFTEPNGRLFFVNQSIYDTAGFPTDYLNNNYGSNTVTINFGSPVYAFAADIGSVFNWGPTPNHTITFSVTGGSGSITLPGYMAYSLVAPDFFGLSSTTPFSQVTINDPTQGLAIEDFAFTTQSLGAPSPAPGAGFASLAFLVLAGAVARGRNLFAR
jgi:hypothetical protein